MLGLFSWVIIFLSEPKKVAILLVTDLKIFFSRLLKDGLKSIVDFISLDPGWIRIRIHQILLILVG